MVSAIAELLMAKQAPRGMLEADEVIATTAAAQDTLSEDVPPPPYTEEHICTNDAAVACDHPECKYTATSWGRLFKHAVNPQTKGGHGRQWRSLHGTYLHTLGTKKMSAEQNKRNQKKHAVLAKKGKATPKPALGQHHNEQSMLDSAGQASGTITYHSGDCICPRQKAHMGRVGRNGKHIAQLCQLQPLQ